MANGTTAWDIREQLAADAAQGQRDSAYLYAQDSRYNYQTRADKMSIKEGLAFQTANTSQVAKEAMQLRTGVQTPPIIVQK